MNDAFEQLDSMREAFDSIEPAPHQQERWQTDVVRVVDVMLAREVKEQMDGSDPVPWRTMWISAAAAVLALSTLLVNPLSQDGLRERLAEARSALPTFDFLQHAEDDTAVGSDVAMNDGPPAPELVTHSESLAQSLDALFANLSNWQDVLLMMH
ncbi:MAG: hypothetical protein ACR2GY_14330 [Phycisphaerales bacterium]